MTTTSFVASRNSPISTVTRKILGSTSPLFQSSSASSHLPTIASSSSYPSSAAHLPDAERYKKVKKIGKGSFGDVYRGVDVLTDEVVAIKVIDLESADEEIDEIRQEISVLSECQSPFITRYISSFTTEHELNIVMEYMGGGSVRDLLAMGPIDEQYVAVITREMLRAVEYLHDSGKIHRDIKAANVLLTEKGEPKMADFGVTAKLTNTMQRRNTFVGTPYWMSPEVIQQADYNEKADIWSIGITVYEMATQEPPHHDVHPMKALFLIPKHPPPSLNDLPHLSKAIKEFVSLCCQKEWMKRPTVKELMKTKFIRQAKKISILQEMMNNRQEINEGDSEQEEEGEDER